MPEPEIRTIAPNTRCVNATKSAAYENRRRVTRVPMGSNADVEVAPSHHEHDGERDCRDDGPRELGESTR
jgi:hypothetical protein